VDQQGWRQTNGRPSTRHGVRSDVSHLSHGKQFHHGVNGGGRAPAADLLGVRVAGRSKSGISNTGWSIVVVLRLDVALDVWEAVGV
jgi:hypothetical protein